MDRWQATSIVSVSKGITVAFHVGLALLAPLLLLIGIFFFGALGALLFELLQDGPVNAIGTFGTILSKPLYQTIALRTFWLSATVTGLTVVIGYWTAYAIWRSPRHRQVIWIALVLFPLFTSVVVRTYAWTMLMNRNGVINSILIDLGLIDQPLRMLGTAGAVLVGMVQVMLPFAILPIYTLLLRLDEDLLRASAISGARGWQTIWHVVLPLTKQGTIVATVLVFVISMGFFITPAILGGPRFSMISNLISMQITTYSDLKTGAGLSILLLLVTLGLLFVVNRIGNLADHLRN